MGQKRIRTPNEVKDEFARKGICLSSWARQHGIAPRHVYDVLGGRTMGKYGDAHRAAVLLGIKRGELDDNVEGATSGEEKQKREATDMTSRQTHTETPYA